MNAWIVDALAVYRITHLITGDVILEDIRNPIVEWSIDNHHRKLRTFVTCPWCVSPYAAVAVMVARRRFPALWGPIATALAYSAVSGVVATSIEH